MLQYFPTPYPDELWYSVLGRYHVRSGNPNSATTLRELFGAESVGGMGNFQTAGSDEWLRNCRRES